MKEYLNKKDFINSMKELKKIIDDVHNVDDALRKLDPDFGGFFISRVINVNFHLLKNIFNDKDDWIEYYVYELNWGKSWKKGMITSKEGDDIKLKTLSDLYKILIKK